MALYDINSLWFCLDSCLGGGSWDEKASLSTQITRQAYSGTIYKSGGSRNFYRTH